MDTIEFFDGLFGAQDGYICIATAPIMNPRSGFRQNFFEWPEQVDDCIKFIFSQTNHKNLWFCVNLLSKPERKKDNCLPTSLIWSDLDTASIDAIDIPPSVVIRSSPDRHQAIWLLEDTIDSFIAEDYSKRVAYRYGADKSGWDLTQLLRIPGTMNFKYPEAPVVSIERFVNVRANPVIFEQIPRLWDLNTESSFEDTIPTELPDAKQTIVKHWDYLKNTSFSNLFDTEPPPTDDWSRILWKLVNILVESGMSDAEALSVANLSNCNKYRRDDRPIKYLWRDVLKASTVHKQINALRKGAPADLQIPDIILTDTSETFIDEYKSWAVSATDAVEQFHELAAFILLSALCSNSLKLKTSYGELVPNLWGLILGDSTLSRKTTAMRMATDFIAELDRDIVLATDGSAEGLLTGLSQRPNRTSIFLKDEISGFFDSINRRDYLAGMPETLTALYDVPEFFTRRLRKEVINVQHPIFIFFGGGIREKVYALVSEEYILSGFLPRFLVVSGETNISDIRRTGPPSQSISHKRNRIIHKLADMYETYSAYVNVTIVGQKTQMPPYIEAVLTDPAWNLYGEVEHKMVMAASDSVHRSIALPTFERLSRSLLKMAMLLAASAQTPENNTIEVTEKDISNAASYIQNWGTYSIDLILNAGNSQTERVIMRAHKLVERNPGILRSTIMQRMKLTKKDADIILQTLEERDQIRSVKNDVGRGHRHWAV